MASQAGLRWPLPSIGSLNGCLLPAATIIPGSETLSFNVASPAPPFGSQSRRHPSIISFYFPASAAAFERSSFSSPRSDHQAIKTQILPRQSLQERRDALIQAREIRCGNSRHVPSVSRAVSDQVSPSVLGEDSQEKIKGKEGARKKIAIFVSGGGSNYKAIQAAIEAGKVNGEVVVVVSDKPGCKAIDFATERGVDICAYPKSAKFAPDGISAEDLVHFLQEKQVDIVLLAGFLKLLPAELVKAFPRAILNIHPALLPAFGGKGYYGLRVHAAVIKSGAWFSGPTVHFIDENYDAGVIVAQRIVRVLPTDTPEELQARVLREEHQLYPKVVAALCDGRIRWREDGVPVLDDESDLDASVPSRNVQAIV